jgi:hypothetical protein
MFCQNVNPIESSLMPEIRSEFQKLHSGATSGKQNDIAFICLDLTLPELRIPQQRGRR